MIKKEKRYLNPDEFISMNMDDRARLTDDALTGLDMAAFHEQGITSMNGLFSGCASLENPDLSNLNTSGVTGMTQMFENCKNLRRLDLSTFDLNQVKDMKAMFCGCESLEEVILSDTICSAVMIPRDYVCPYTIEELNWISRDVYISSGPELAAMAVERAEKNGKHMTTDVPFHQATEDEVYRYLGLLYGQQKLTVVPHRALQNEKPTPERVRGASGKPETDIIRIPREKAAPVTSAVPASAPVASKTCPAERNCTTGCI